MKVSPAHIIVINKPCFASGHSEVNCNLGRSLRMAANAKGIRQRQGVCEVDRLNIASADFVRKLHTYCCLKITLAAIPDLTHTRHFSSCSPFFPAYSVKIFSRILFSQGDKNVQNMELKVRELLSEERKNQSERERKHV